MARPLASLLKTVAPRPLPTAALLFMGGIALAEYSASAVALVLLVVFIVPSLLLLRNSRREALLLALLSLFLVTGYLRQIIFADLSGEENSVAHLTGSRVEVRAVVFDVPERGRRSTHLGVEAISCNREGNGESACEGRVMLYIRERGGNFAAGDMVSFTASLRPLSGSGNPGEFDYAAYLRNRGFRAAAFLHKPSSVKILHKRFEDGIIARADSLRSDFSAWMDTNIPDAQDAALLKALTIGLRKGISDEIKQNFARGGTAHLLAISGLHLGVIALLVYMLMLRPARILSRLIPRFNAEQIAAAATLLPLWGFALLAGLRVSTMRAAVTATVYLAGRLLRRPADGINSLALAALLVLALYPFSLYEAAFQLSFMCVAAIIIGAPALESILPQSWRRLMYAPLRRAALLRYFFFIFVSSLITFIATAPVLLAHFNMLSWMGLFSNLLLVPAVTLAVIPLAMCAMLLHMAGLPFADHLLQIAAFVFDPFIRLQNAAVEHLGGAWYFSSPPTFAAFLYFSALFMLAAPWLSGPSWLERETLKPRRLTPRIAGLLLLACAVVAYFVQSETVPRRSFYAVIPHSRHGSALVVSDAEGRIEISGSGWREAEFAETVSRVIAPLLWDMRAGRVDSIYLMQSRIDKYMVERGLGRFFDINEITEVWKTQPSTKDSGRINSLARSGGGRLPALLYRKDKAALLVVGQPHLVDERAWSEIAAELQGLDLAVVWHGPGKIEIMQALARELKPQILALAMDSKLARYISRDSWLEGSALFDACARSDYDGALRFAYMDAEGWKMLAAEEL